MQAGIEKRTRFASAMRVFMAVVLVLLVWSWWVNFTTLPFHSDSGYYLSSAERIHEGWKPYKDFRVGYTPVGMYYFSLFSGLPFEGHISYRAGLLLVQVVSALLLFILSRPFIRSGALRVAGVLFYLLLMQTYDGRLIMLEPFVALFGLMTILLLMKNPANRYMLAFPAGVAFSLAVLSKQYGLFIAPVVAVLVWFDTKGHLLPHRVALGRLLLLCAGFILPLVGFVMYIDIGLVPLLEQLGGSGYGADGFLNMVRRLMDIRRIWFVGILVISVILARRKFRFDLFVVILTFSLGYVPLLVRIPDHYLLMLLPYGVLLLAYTFEQYFLSDERPPRRMFENLIMVVMCVSLFMAVYDSVHTTAYYGLGDGTRKYLHDNFGKNKPALKDEYEIAARINKTFPPGSPTLVISSRKFIYLCGFNPVSRDLGYTFFNRRTREKFDLSRIDNIVWVNWKKRADYASTAEMLKVHHRRIDSFSTPHYWSVELWSKK